MGGTTGGWKLLVGEWAELGEEMLKLEVLACATCGKVELRVPRSTQGPAKDTGLAGQLG